MPFFRKILTKRIRGRIAAIVLVATVAGISGMLLFGEQLEEKFNPESSQELISNNSSLGLTYLTITPNVAAYYDLEIDTGVLVTAVTSDSLANHAGIKPGDVIVSYNTVRLDKDAPLYGMIRSCRPGTTVVLEVWRGNINNTFEFVHTQ
ncbi:MAG: PDZ domain-containing protein [Chloroflexi bacterium]|jgi:C-terminal processing protease CtpA/Prc|nr:PDZ domain-containing protein [Chloroflexota bacterium]